MAVIKVYNRINWLNKSESLTTPLGKTNLNKMDKAIDTIDNEVVSISATAESLDTTKADRDQLNNMITDIAINDKNGVISITKYNGTVLNIDTAMEKIAVNFEYNAQTQQLILTLENGEKQYIDMSALITQYEFKGTDTIAFSIDSDGKVNASIKSGSITKAMLSSEVMSAITLSESNAVASAQAAAQSATNADMDAKLSQSYSVGKSGIRDGEDTDNAKYYSEQAKNYADKAQQATKQIEIDSELSETSENVPQTKIVTKEINNIKKNITVNLLKSTCNISSMYGITCTNNGDGTYTVKGTATSDVMIELGAIKRINKQLKICGSPSGAGLNTYGLYFGDIIMDSTADVGNGVMYYSTDGAGDFLFVFVKNGQTVNSAVFKPMVTTNVDATYDDFVPYTGDTGSVSGDVADIKTKIDGIEPGAEVNQNAYGEIRVVDRVDGTADFIKATDKSSSFTIMCGNGIRLAANNSGTGVLISARLSNNLVTTGSGTALDAKQGKILNDKIEDLKKTVSDGKSAIASAITDAGVSTASDASFATMSSNIATVRTDTTYTDKSHIIYGETAYVQGKKVTGTMPSYRGNIWYFGGFANFIGNENYSMWTGGRCSLYLAAIRHIKMTFSLTGSSGNNNTPTTSTEQDGYGVVRFGSRGNDGYIQCFASNEQTIDLEGYDKILVRVAVNSDVYAGSYFLRGWIGLTDSRSGDTSSEGQSEMIAAAMYNSTSKDKWEYFEYVLDVANLTGKKYMKVSMTHSGVINIDSCTFLPKREY
ncbi:hypothetical protein [Butyribacter intestini]|jgi:hypothetical protein|uniref:Uncharacterized protein n=1 Tax=Butyribacter intestini TaxID=1703332 RepID=A0AAW3JU18_9FIRM|nr:hypothetical protein [Butyribacter intestini]KQC86053.1 hypothetical protein APZ18_02340 [Butyribacter intestini]RHU77157.1 hypothetical protein DXC30_02375 [Butyribacter intestini]